MKVAGLEELARRPFSYAEVGATAGPLPSGYAHLRASRGLGRGGRHFAAAVETLMSWGMHERAGVGVTASARRVEADAVAVLAIGYRWLRLDAPVRVVCLVDEPDAYGFAYGTLPGHPESGEERFVIRRVGEEVRAEITAFSRPGTALARAVGPAGRVAQRLMTRRYLGALEGGGLHR